MDADKIVEGIGMFMVALVISTLLMVITVGIANMGLAYQECRKTENSRLYCYSHILDVKKEN